MKQYLDALRKIMSEGDDRQTRNAVTRACFGIQLRFNMRDGFPTVTTKKLAFKSVAAELLWFLEGSTDLARLKKVAGFDLKIWDGDAKQHFEKGKAKYEGDLGPVYGKQWRRWSQFRHVPAHTEGAEWVPDAWKEIEIDQLKEVIERIKTNPFDRRLIVNAWNPSDIDQMALPPCHMFFQFFVYSDGRLSLHMYQRSCDTFLGVPFNIASYALLLHMVAQVTGLTPDECIITLGDVHVYHEHFKQVEEQLSRKPLELPQLCLNPGVTDIDNFTMADIELRGYRYHPPIKAPLLTQDLER